MVAFWKKNRNNVELYEGLQGNELAITDYLTDGLLIFNQDNKLFLINPRAEGFFEVEEKKILGKTILELSHFPRLEPLVSFLGGGIKEVSCQELQITENFILETTTVSIMRGHTKVCALVILHDISREKLNQKMKTEFVTIAAHQLRTPTSAVKWSLEMLLEGAFGELKEEQKKVLEKAHQTNDKAIRLVSDLLNVAEIEEGRYLSKLKLSDIKEVILFVAKEYQEQIKNKNLKFEFKEPKEKLPKVMLDIEKIKIAVRNILDNAIRYTRAGGRVLIAARKIDKRIEIQIQDTGLGIPLGEQEKIFSKFFRASNITKVDTEGTGLGLYIAKNIIEAHDGSIWFESEKDRGTTFYFTLPVREKFGEYLTEEFY